MNIIAFDFSHHTLEPIALDALGKCQEQGMGCWIDLEGVSGENLRETLDAIGVSGIATEELFGKPDPHRLDVHEECLHLTLMDLRLTPAGVSSAAVEVLVGTWFFVTIRNTTVPYMDKVKQVYRGDFQRYAETLSFMLYEVWDKLIESYHEVLRELSPQVVDLQDLVFDAENDEIFNEAARLMQKLRAARKCVLGARNQLEHLAARKSPFVSESSQPYLLNLLGALDRVSNDLTVERETLAEALDLYVGIVGHRTNRVVNRLTMISAIFLPLMFLCGVYGMNLKMPEFDWQFGYLYFWGMVIVSATVFSLWMKSKRWL